MVVFSLHIDFNKRKFLKRYILDMDTNIRVFFRYQTLCRVLGSHENNNRENFHSDRTSRHK